MQRLLLLVFVAIVSIFAGTTHAVITYETREAAASGGPYPTSSIIFDVFYPPDPIHRLEVQMFDAFYPPDPFTPLPMDLFGADNGLSPEGASPGSVGTIGAVTRMTVDEGFPTTTSFDVFIDVSPIPGTSGPTSIINPEIIPNAGRFFDVTFEVPLNGTAEPGPDVFAQTGVPGARVEHLVHFELPEDQAELLIFITPRIVTNAEGIHVLFDLERTSEVPPEPILFTMEITGAVIPEPAAGILLLIGAGLVVRCRNRH